MHREATNSTRTFPDFAEHAGSELVDHLDGLALHLDLFERHRRRLLGTGFDQPTAQAVLVP